MAGSPVVLQKSSESVQQAGNPDPERQSKEKFRGRTLCSSAGRCRKKKRVQKSRQDLPGSAVQAQTPRGRGI